MHDPVIASMASIESREKSLYETVLSIYDQVDKLYVYLNDYSKIPNFLRRDKIEVILSVNGDLGDSGKFFPVDGLYGYIFTMDDDIIYPENYVRKMCEKIDFYQKKAFICVEGGFVPKHKLTSFYDEVYGFRFDRVLAEDASVEIPGTGTLAFHSLIGHVNMEDFKNGIMTDIWLYLFCERKNIPRIAIQRPQGWLKDTNHLPPTSLSSECSRDDTIQTDIINQFRKDQGVF